MVSPRKPSLKTLQTFATTARLESFKAAAEALHVSPSAISHQIKSLELWLGVVLFERSTRRVSLTQQGRELAGQLNLHFASIEQVLADARQQDVVSTLKISALPLFTTTWLIPRLSDFEQIHPDVRIELDTVSQVRDLSSDGIDIGIRNSPLRHAGLVHQKLIDLQAVPLCTPKLASDIEPHELLELPLIVQEGRRNRWQWWLEQQDISAWPPVRLLTVDSIPAAMAAATQGAGVMLGLSPLIWEAVGVEKLHNPVRAPLISGGSYTLVFRKQDKAARHVQAFVSWLTEAMHKDMTRLTGLAKARA